MGHSRGRSAPGNDERQLSIVFGLTLFCLAAEVVGGVLTDSLARLADAAGVRLALLAIRFARGNLPLRAVLPSPIRQGAGGVGRLGHLSAHLDPQP